jgi:general secretion pathway protein G
MMRRKGFTLIELVVVILILGILAGVAAPKMLNTSAKATDNGLKQTLSIIRDAIELHQSQNGSLPPCTAPGANFRAALVPFMRGPFPKCPVGPAAAQDNDIVPVSGVPTGDAAPTSGWKYSTDTGEFICNFASPSATDASVNYSQF